MSDCHKSQDLYSIVMDQEASQHDQRFFDGHLSSCSGCRHDWLDFKASQAMLKDLPRVAVSASFEDRVMAGVREAVREARPASAWAAQETEPRWWQVWIPRVGLAAATAAVVIVSMLSIPDQKASPTFVGRLEDRFPDLPPEVLRSLDEESYVLDRMTLRPGTNGDSRVVAPVDFEPGGAVYVTF